MNELHYVNVLNSWKMNYVMDFSFMERAAEFDGDTEGLFFCVTQFDSRAWQCPFLCEPFAPVDAQH